MGRKAVKGIIPTEIRVAVVWLRWSIGARCPREPLRCMMSLQAGHTQPLLVTNLKWPPIQSTYGRSPPVRLLLGYHTLRYQTADNCQSPLAEPTASRITPQTRRARDSLNLSRRLSQKL